MDIVDVRRAAEDLKVELEQRKLELQPPEFWYPYGTLNTLVHLDALLHGENRDLDRLARGGPVADIGGQDGDLSFLIERLGYEVQLFDWPWTNFNHFRGAPLMKEALASNVSMTHLNLDEPFELPAPRYSLILLLGVLYHLRNPFYVLENLAQKGRYLLLSTKVMRYGPGGATRLEGMPLAYLVDPDELNNDATNYWIFTNDGLQRLLKRAGWIVREYMSAGNTVDSDPVSFPDKDERAFCLLESTRLTD